MSSTNDLSHSYPSKRPKRIFEDHPPLDLPNDNVNESHFANEDLLYYNRNPPLNVNPIWEYCKKVIQQSTLRICHNYWINRHTYGTCNKRLDRHNNCNRIHQLDCYVDLVKRFICKQSPELSENEKSAYTIAIAICAEIIEEYTTSRLCMPYYNLKYLNDGKGCNDEGCPLVHTDIVSYELERGIRRPNLEYIRIINLTK